MTTRNRSRTEYSTGYRTRRWDGGVESKSIKSLSQNTEDVTGLGDNQPFRSDLITKSGGTITGNEKSNRTGYNWNDYPCTYQRTDSWATSHMFLNTPDVNILASELLKRTNPSRASIDAAVNLIELRELPGLVKDGLDTARGRLFKHIPRPVFRRLKQAAKLNLMIQFGILPLYSDITKLTQFQSIVDGRVREIERLQTRGLRRTVPLHKVDHTYVSKQRTVQSQGVSLKADIVKRTEIEIRGHVRWRVPQNFYLSDGELRSKAAQLVLARQLDVQAVYELMPWSWLLDYFSNLGDFVSLSRNSLNATHDAVRIMTQTTTTVKSRNHSSHSRVTLSPFDNKNVSKRRSIVSGGLAAQVDFLTNQQMSILGSLSVVKGLLWLSLHLIELKEFSMFSDTLTLTFNGVAKQLIRINQDGYSSEYLLREDEGEYSLRIRNSQYKRSNNVGVDRHNVEVIHTKYATVAGEPPIIRKSYIIFENDDGDSLQEAARHTVGMVGFLTEPNILKMLNRES